MSTPVNPAIQKVLDAAEVSRKQGDAHFEKNEYQEATESYNACISAIAPIRLLPFGEECALRALVNVTECHMKLGALDKALAASSMACTIPAALADIPVLKKLFIHRAQIYQDMDKPQAALQCLDCAISLDTTNSKLAERRESLLQAARSATGQDDFNPPYPQSLTQAEVAAAIGTIFKHHGNPAEVIPMLEHLVSRNVYIDARDEKGNNIMWAICQAAIARASTENENADDVLPLLDLILRYGAHAEQRFTSGTHSRTALQMMCVAGASDCVSLLLQHHAGSSTCDENGWTPLIIACSPNHPRTAVSDPSNDAVVDALLQAKAPPNYRAFNGLCALSMACQSGDVNSANLLINAGATLNNRDATGFSPMVWSLVTGHDEKSEVVEALLESMTDPKMLEEAQEDIKCVKFSKVILKQKVTVNEFVKSLSEEEKQALGPSPLQLVLAVAKQLLASGGIDGELKDVTLESYAALVSNLQAMLPTILFKHVLPLDDPHAAMQSLETIERCQLLVCSTAATGPNREPLLAKLPNFSYLVPKQYPDYRLLMHQPLCHLFSSVIPDAPTLDAISSLAVDTGVAHYASEGSSFWVKLLRDRSIDVSVVGDEPIETLFDMEAMPSERLAEMSAKPLVVMWPFSRLPSIGPVDEKHFNEVSLSRYDGNTVVILGEISEDIIASNSDEHEHLNPAEVRLRTYLTTHYEIAQTIALEKNWPETENFMTVWKRKTA